ncbi:hypothetical protein SAMN05216344_105196 [Polaromonas sp. OV174]|uniref:hypothetical protein n=1 Tax=Polaromonas sp. OV174 TaxID=1855300 RepID=UPI0008E0507A|nr:hypothetical protein [Polaromonas sp. OV174]SFB92483.1 hypothetical protein SAMN05216344_105196 [Polaromonas sp. OV174]
MQRRTLLALGAASAAVLLLAGGPAAWLQPGWRAGALTPVGREVFAAVGQAVLAQSLPAQDGPRQTAINGLLSRIDVLVRALPSHAQAELSQLLSLLASTPGRHALAGLDKPWPKASIAEIQQALQGMRLSTLALRQQAYAALHDISTGAYFSDPASWPLLGYPGPLQL